MKRQRQSVTTRVYAYGCLPPTAGWATAGVLGLALYGLYIGLMTW